MIYKIVYKMIYKFLILVLITITISCNVSYLDSIKELQYLSTKQILTLEDKDFYYPAWDISIRKLQNKSKDRAFTAEQKEITLRIMSVIRFVLNTPEYEANIIKRTDLTSKETKSARTTSEKVVPGTPLDSERVLRTVQKTLLETEIDLFDTYKNGVGVVGLGTVPNYYPYFEDPYHNEYTNHMKHYYKQTWIGFSGKYDIVDTLDDYANIGNTILHESVHNLGFTHGSAPGGDVAYTVGDAYSATLRNSKFLEKYKDEFKKLIPYFEEKYSEFITYEPAVKSLNKKSDISGNYDIKTHSSRGEPLTIIECIIENHEDYVKPFRYVVQNGQRIRDDFILK